MEWKNNFIWHEASKVGECQGREVACMVWWVSEDGVRWEARQEVPAVSDTQLPAKWVLGARPHNMLPLPPDSDLGMAVELGNARKQKQISVSQYGVGRG